MLRATLRPAVVALAGVAVLAAACGGGGSKAQPTKQATSTPAVRATTVPTGSSGNESGQAPIFWRTKDNFASLETGVPYKVVFRVTGGYAEPTLSVSAVCQTCSTPGQQQPIAFEPTRAEPAGEEAPGSYYPSNITLPFAGTWQITVVAGSDHETITVEAAAASAG